jgi:hypothetical protein
VGDRAAVDGAADSQLAFRYGIARHAEPGEQGLYIHERVSA